jgi:SAM-dependent methyltransferase
VTAARRWAEELEAWRIPDPILAQAPEPPWAFPTHLFTADQSPVGALHRTARQALAEGGTVLDVGCGGGAASVALVPPAVHLTGVDRAPAMLESFARAAEQAGASHTEIEGNWPEVAAGTSPADVVVCRNVVYNVAGVVPFVSALSEHAVRRVVVELTDRHPSVPMAPLWKRFWNLDRPDGPTSDLFIEVLHDMGVRPQVEHEIRPALKARLPPAEQVAFVRRRLCLGPERDLEIAAALADPAGDDETTSVVLHWRP